MKPKARSLALSLVLPILSAAALANAIPAHAGHGHRAGPGAYPGAYPGHHAYRSHHGHHGHHGHRHHGRGHGGMWGPLIVGGLIGAALVGASTAQAQPQPPVVVPAAPALPSHLITAPAMPPLLVFPPQPLPPRAQYFCAPYRAFYPFVTNCPEPWYLMPQ